MAKNMTGKLIYFTALIAALTLGACKNECEDCDFDPVYYEPSRAMFHYLAMDNNLSSFGQGNLNDMIKGATKENLNGGAIVVFSDFPSKPSELLYIHAGKDGNGEAKVLYQWTENLDASKPETFKAAFEMAQKRVKTDSWVLGAGSHGTGWIPFSMHNNYLTRRSFRAMTVSEPEPWYVRDPFRETETRAFLNDGSAYMDIGAFAEAIPDDTFDFVVMDICFMGEAEFAYALRKKAKHLILSPAEVIAYGMPYDRIIKHIFADTPRLGAGGICEEYYNYYMNDFTGDSKFATIALYDCSKLDALAEAMKDVVGPKHTQINQMTRAYLKANIQYFDRYSNHTMFDMAMFVHDLYAEGDPTRVAFDKALADVVTYKKTTGMPLEGFVIPENRYCGISTYIPIAEYDDLNTEYLKTDWAKAVYVTQ